MISRTRTCVPPPQVLLHACHSPIGYAPMDRIIIAFSILCQVWALNATVIGMRHNRTRVRVPATATVRASAPCSP